MTSLEGKVYVFVGDTLMDELFFINYVFMYIFIHSAGVGRSGTFITLDAMMERLKERDDFNIFKFVNEMRTQRMKMVQTLVSRILSDAYSVTCITLFKFNTLYTPLTHSYILGLFTCICNIVDPAGSVCIHP